MTGVKPAKLGLGCAGFRLCAAYFITKYIARMDLKNHTQDKQPVVYVLTQVASYTGCQTTEAAGIDLEQGVQIYWGKGRCFIEGVGHVPDDEVAHLLDVAGYDVVGDPSKFCEAVQQWHTEALIKQQGTEVTDTETLSKEEEQKQLKELLTLRDNIAKTVYVTLIANSGTPEPPDENLQLYAEISYTAADALLEARQKSLH